MITAGSYVMQQPAAGTVKQKGESHVVADDE